MTEKPTVFADGSTMSPQEVMVAQQRAIIDVSQDAWPAFMLLVLWLSVS